MSSLLRLSILFVFVVCPFAFQSSSGQSISLVDYRLLAALQPNGVAVDDSGRVYVADQSNGRVVIFAQSGSVLTTWSITGSILPQPIGIVVDRTSGYPYSGNVYVSDSANGGGRIVVFNSSGVQVNTFQGGQLRSIGQVALDGQGRVWTCDLAYGTVYGFDMQSGTVVASVAGFTNLGPTAIAFSTTVMYVLGIYNGNAIYQVTNGSITATWQLPASANPISLAIGVSGTVLFVVDDGGSLGYGSVMLVDSNTGRLIRFVNASTTNGAVSFSRPRGVWVESHAVFVTDSGNRNRVLQLDESMTVVQKVYNTTYPQMDATSVAFDTAGSAWIADRSGSRMVQIATDTYSVLQIVPLSFQPVSLDIIRGRAGADVFVALNTSSLSCLSGHCTPPYFSQIISFTPDGAIVSVSTVSLENSPQLRVDSQGLVYITGVSGGVVRYDALTETISQVYNISDAATSFLNSKGVTFDSSRNVYTLYTTGVGSITATVVGWNIAGIQLVRFNVSISQALGLFIDSSDRLFLVTGSTGRYAASIINQYDLLGNLLYSYTTVALAMQAPYSLMWLTITLDAMGNAWMAEPSKSRVDIMLLNPHAQLPPSSSSSTSNALGGSSTALDSAGSSSAAYREISTSSSNTAVIAGAVVGGVAGGLILVLSAFLLARYLRRLRARDETSSKSFVNHVDLSETGSNVEMH